MTSRVTSAKQVEIANAYLNGSDITQAQIARRYGVSVRSVRRYVKHQRSMREKEAVEQAIKRVMLQRRLFATLAEAIDEISEDAKAREKPSLMCWYVGYERKIRGGSDKPHFNSVLPLDDSMATTLLERGKKPKFKEQAKCIRSNNPDGPLQERAYEAIKDGWDALDGNHYDFLLSVYQLIYSFRGEINFIEGWVHREMQKYFGDHGWESEKLFWVKLLDVEEGILPKIDVYSEDLKPLAKAKSQFIEGVLHEQKDEAFAEWKTPEEDKAETGWVACMPIFDGSTPCEKSLRGFLSWKYKDEGEQELQTRGLIHLKDYLNKKRRSFIQERINQAYREGVRNYILDSYTNKKIKSIEEDPFQHWIDELIIFLGWEKGKSTRNPYSVSDPYRVLDGTAEIPLDCLIEHFENSWSYSGRSLISEADVRQLRPKHKSWSVFYKVEGAESEGYLKGYLKSRVYEAINLLEDILHKREALVQKRRLKKRAVETAITNVFARNFAHNIGSHVAINAGNRKIRARVDELYQGDINSGSEHASDWLDYMTERLNQYQVQRNEYLADFLNQSPVPMRLYRDLVLDFAENAILMDNLAKSERICFKRRDDGCVRNRLRICAFIGGEEIQCSYPSAQDTEACGEDVVYPKAFPYVVLGKEHENGERDDVNEVFNNPDIGWVGSGSGESDVEVIVSNPHAFYSILENFTRNSAKHCEDKLREPENGWPDDLEVYVSAEENAESYCITLHDNVSVIGVEQALHFQKNAIEGSLLGDDMEPTRENSGIADMKVNAFLLSKPPEALSDDALTEEMDVVICDKNCGEPSDRDFKRLREFKDDEDAGSEGRPLRELRTDVGQEGYFGYQFRFPKPKKVCWVGPHEIDLEATPDELGREGLAFHETAKAYFEASQGEKASLASYDFAVLREEAVRGWMEAGEDAQARLDRLLLALPCRALLVAGGRPEDDDPLTEAVGQRRVVEVKDEKVLLARGVDESVADGLLRRCWHAWLARWGVEPDKKAQVYLYAFEDTVGRWMGGEGNPRKVFPDTFGPVDLTLVAKENEEEGNEDNGDETEEESVEAALKDNLPDEERRLVIYERHGGFNKVFSPKKYREHVAPRLRSSEFTNTFEKTSTDFAQLNYPPKNVFQRELLTYRLVEAGLLRVLVVDERLADLSEEDLDGSLEYVFVEGEGRRQGVPSEKSNFWHQASAANVFLATRVAGESAGDLFHVDSERRKQGLRIDLRQEGETTTTFEESEENGETSNQLFDVVVVHRTLFIKMRECIKREDETEEAASERLVRELRQCASFVVIDSGGGEPHGIDRSVAYRFLSYSKLSKCFTSSGSKHVIAKVKLANQLLTLRKNAPLD